MHIANSDVFISFYWFYFYYAKNRWFEMRTESETLFLMAGRTKRYTNIFPEQHFSATVIFKLRIVKKGVYDLEHLLFL